jgi:hypothetical protein
LRWLRVCGRSLDDGPRDGGRLAAGEEPAGGDRYQRHAEDDEDEGEHGDPTEIAEIVVVGRCEREIVCRDAWLAATRPEA